MPQSREGTEMLQRAFLESYKEGIQQGFLIGQKDPIQGVDDVFLKAYAVSKTKARIEVLEPTEKEEEKSSIIIKS